MDQRIVDLSSVKYFVLDEADEMLSFGFKESLETIWQALGAQNEAEESDDETADSKSEKSVYTWLFSATMSESIHRLTSEYLSKPIEIRLNQNQEPIKVESFAAVVYQEEKEDALSLAILAEKDFYGIIFAQTKQQVAQLELKLRSFGIEVDSLHGDKVQAERARTIKRFKNRETQILVATDVAARGLDVENLSHVVNFELPWDAETYTHRIGRTARAGKQGTVWNLVTPKEAHLLRKFEARLKISFKKLNVPSKQEVHELIIRNWLKSVIDSEKYDREFESLDGALNGIESDKLEISYEAKIWLAKVIKFLHIGAPNNLKTPRILDLHTGPAKGGQKPRREGGSDRDFRGGSSRFRGGSRGGRSEGYSRNEGFSRGDSDRRDSYRGDSRNDSPRRDSSRGDSFQGGERSRGNDRAGFSQRGSRFDRGSSSSVAGESSRGARFSGGGEERKPRRSSDDSWGNSSKSTGRSFARSGDKPSFRDKFKKKS